MRPAGPLRILAAVLLGVVGLAPALSARDAFVLVTGETLLVDSYEYDGDRASLKLAGGGRIVVPFERIDTIIAAPEDPPPPSADADVPPPKREDRAGIWEKIAAICREAGVDPDLVFAVVQVESNFDPAAISDRGAVGLMQLLPETAERYDVVDLFDARENLRGGVLHLRRLLDRYDGRVELALAAYNAGEGRVDRRMCVPPIRETREYVRRVLALYRMAR